ncbi:hypothetical protein TIFTF001_031772 [Ficus carica]|uniref:Uncharacterized protein n=1 Tax=Ficus carica TaxID=3494 RepID=A0AA88E216_FICCA|nr:hypothetical protein TIFTF001_031772 [Ficus carica]
MDSPNSLETLIKEYIAMNDARVQSHDATLRTLENQIGQIANALNVRPQGSLPSNTEDPRREGKEHCKAILLRNGREIERREKPKAVQNEPTSIQEQDEPHQQEEILLVELILDMFLCSEKMNKCKGGRFGRIGRDSRKQFCIGISLTEQSVLKMLRECYSISGKIWGAICAENA